MLWVLWVSLTVPAGLFVVVAIVYGGNRSFLLIGRTTDGHHQIELACDSCHTKVFGDAEVLQDACMNCHGAALKAEDDKHPKSKFTDPRNADRTALLDARYCVTCHREHRPGITRAMGVTMPTDYCYICHHDIADDRPSHAGLAFNTCASAGCHKFHDNRALYQDFLIKHSGERDQLVVQRIDLKAWLDGKERRAKEKPALTVADADAPSPYKTAEAITAWARDPHASAGVNCSGCHTTKQEPATWIESPGIAACQSCHTDQVRTFAEGKHGMRLREGLFSSHGGPFGLFDKKPLPPITPAQARLPMKAKAAHLAVGCSSCHVAHGPDTRRAQVDACTGCHDDGHTKAYFDSKHYRLFKEELAGGARGTGVSCATCHMPVIETRSEYGEKAVFATHNQNDNLRPNEKMVRTVCSSCHGLQFTLDSLADANLVKRNFTGRPSVHVETLEWAQKRAQERRQAKN